MEASYFYALVLPLGIFVFLLASLAFYYARKEELASKRWKELTDAHMKVQLQEGDTMSKELKGLEKLFLNNSIDQFAYERLKKVLEDDRKVNVESDCSKEDATCSIT